MHSSWQSVQEQTGVFAGSGGYDITVGKHTQLDGAVIASTATADKNSLDTGTLGWSDIHNQADYKTEHQSVGFNSGGPIGANLLSNVSALPISGSGSEGHAEGTTKAAVSEGSITVRDTAKQQQDVSTLNRDTEHANDGSITPIFNKEKEQKRLQQAQLVSDIASQALDIYNTHEATKATREATAALGDKSRQGVLEDRAKKALAEEKKFNPKVDDGPQAVAGKAWQLAYDDALAAHGAQMGGSVSTGVNAVVSALQGLAGGDIRSALAQGAAPYLAGVVKTLTTQDKQYSELSAAEKANNALAHALLGGVVAELSGGNAAAGATGAATGELAAPAIALALYGTADSSKLTSQQKENLSALATLASGIASGVSSDSTAGTVTGGLAGKNAVENNALSSKDEKQRQDAKWSLPYLEGEKKQQAEKLISDLNAKDKAFDAKLNVACQGLSSAACQGMRQELAVMAKSYDEQLDGQYVGNMGSVYKEGKGQVDALMWQYASADAKAEREANVNRIAENWGVSKETADNLYTAMAGVHTTAAIGGAVYGMKGENIPVAKGNASETYFRVEGGGSGTKTSQNRISANADGSVTINSGCSGQLCVSTNGPNHASYYVTNKRADGSVVVFEVDAALHKQIMDAAVPQKPIPGIPKDPNAPKIVDPNKGEPSVSLELPKVWDRLIEQNSSKARVLTKEEFMNEFGK